MAFQRIQGGSVTSARGFRAGAVFADIKAWIERPFDLAILLSDEECDIAGVFTRNRVKAAPVLLCQERVRSGKARAVVANSGCANCCTGDQGLLDAHRMAELTAERLGISENMVLVASTGVIGTAMPMDRIAKGIRRIETVPDGGHDFALAIMTTDTVPKEIAVEVNVDGAMVTIGGVAKGAGMIHPDMATMLCFLTTDAAVDGQYLQQVLEAAANVSFNMISVDGDTSTNDSVLIMANGRAGNLKIQDNSPGAEDFQAAVEHVCTYLAKSIARDGEGATKLIEVTVEGAASVEDARRAARTIVSSPLVKTAVYGSDPNWGRVIAAAGRSGAEMEPSRVDLFLNDLCLVMEGRPQSFDKKEAEVMMGHEEVFFRLNLNLGDGEATAWGCDFTEEYIALNGDYTT